MMSHISAAVAKEVSTKANVYKSPPTDKAAQTTVITYVLSRLKDLGISKVFGVAGDFAFPIEDAIVSFPGIDWVGCCNELNAAYAADGYGRIHGIAALNTTYGVGELSAICGIAGAYAEHVPVFHLVGMPNLPTQAAHGLVHHTLGDGEFDFFHKMAEYVVCASAIMTPQNVAYETERLIAEALYHRRPVYMAFPTDLANQPVLSTAMPLDPPKSDPASLEETVAAIIDHLRAAKTACILPGFLAYREGLGNLVQALVDASGLPFATMFADKSALEEQQPAYIGMYDGKLMNEVVREFVESCDTVIQVGTILSDFNTGAFTSHLAPENTVDIRHHRTHVGTKVYPNVEMKDVLTELVRRVTKRNQKPPIQPDSLGPVKGAGSDPISADALYSRWQDFIKPGDIVFTETGTSSMGLAFALLPIGAKFYNQPVWGAIGWATPAAFGAAVAAPDRRVVLITGEGSHQLTAQEIGQFGRRRLRPIVFVLNNSGYLIERLLCKDPEIEYNDLAQWHYAALPKALGCDDWFTARVTTCGEFDQALNTASQGNRGAYIEIVTDKYVAPPLPLRIHENVKALYRT
jgi:indolepyruvate decarboxylase